MGILGGFNNESFVKRNLIAAILIPVLMVGLLSFFLPAQDTTMEAEMNELTQDYFNFTGANPVSEEIWALSGIYTPYTVGEDGQPSTAWGTTPDGWVYGARIPSYTPSQYDGLDPFDHKETYTVTYDTDTGLYYYTAAGADLDVKVAEVGEDGLDPETGGLYTAVSFDPLQQSSVFFTQGSKQTVQEGTYYPFTGYRYVFQPLRDYKASNDMSVDRTTTSLSCVWYNYYGDTGLSGQLMLSGSDSGVSYITGEEIVAAFNEASYSSKFEMVFNGLNLNVYIKINPYALVFGGYTVEECYENGFWSIMVTSPSVTTGDGAFVMDAFSPDRIFDIVVKLLTFQVGDYGLSGIAATLCSFVFVVPFYTTLIAIGLSNYPVLIFAGLLAVAQGIAAAIQGFSFF